mmetsp:Transcript_56973/g.144568  ORF Transcript_56973/g.144568 Transcript_56973/m.144568 type:complete len:286 (-) Transcript_56973:120-977(-)
MPRYSASWQSASDSAASREGGGAEESRRKLRTLRKRLESRSRKMRPSRSRGACARPVKSRSNKLPGCCTKVWRAASKMTPPTLMSTMVSVAMLCSDMRWRSFSASSYSPLNFSRSSMKRLRPWPTSLWIVSLCEPCRNLASSRSWRIWRWACATSCSALFRSSRIRSYASCFCATNSCQTRFFSSSKACRSALSAMASSRSWPSAFWAHFTKFTRISSIMCPKSSCEANRILVSSTAPDPGARAPLGPAKPKPMPPPPMLPSDAGPLAEKATLPVPKAPPPAPAP